MNGARRSEAGVSLVEMLVVLAIVAVLIGMLVSHMGGSKDTGNKTVGRHVARAYYEVAVDFASDNGGAVPKPGTLQWPTARPERGPVNFLNEQSDQRYLRNIPEAVTDGRARLVTVGGGSIGSANAPVTVTYSTTGAQTFDIVASRLGTPYCHLANGPTAGPLPDC
jgi:prepilin-type N-terminal cleavage/methylation domain-containing protein